MVWGLLADLALFHDPPSPLSLLGAALVCSSSFIIVSFEKRGAAASTAAGNGTAPKAKDSSRVLHVSAAAADPSQRQGAEEGGWEPQLELAEGGGWAGRQPGTAVRWGSAADEGGTASLGKERSLEEEEAGAADERAPLVGGAAGRS